MAKTDGGPSNRDEDAAVTLLASLMVDRDVYRQFLAGITPNERQDVENAIDRHAARMRQQGQPGW